MKLEEIKLSDVELLWRVGLNNEQIQKKLGISAETWDTWYENYEASKRLENAIDKKTITPKDFLDNFEIFLKYEKDMSSFTDLLNFGFSKKFLEFCIENGLLEYHENTVRFCAMNNDFDMYDINIKLRRMLIAQREIDMTPEQFRDKYYDYLHACYALRRRFGDKRVSKLYFLMFLDKNRSIPEHFIKWCIDEHLTEYHKSLSEIISFSENVLKILRMFKF